MIEYVEVYKKGCGWIIKTNLSEDTLPGDHLNADVALIMALRHLHLTACCGVADVQMDRAVWVRDPDDYDCNGSLVFGFAMVCLIIVSIACFFN